MSADILVGQNVWNRLLALKALPNMTANTWGGLIVELDNSLDPDTYKVLRLDLFDLNWPVQIRLLQFGIRPGIKP